MDETAPFQIRDFPVALRREIVAEAEAAKVSVSEFMAGVCAVSRAAGWPRVIEGAGRLNGLSARRTEAAAALTPPIETMPKWLRAALWRQVAAQLGIEAPVRQPMRLARVADHGPAPDLDACRSEGTPAARVR